MNEQQVPEKKNLSQTLQGVTRNPSNPKTQPDKQKQAGSDAEGANLEDYESEINPSQFDKDEIDLDRTGVNTSEQREQYQFDKGGDQAGSNLSQPRNSNVNQGTTSLKQ